MWEQRIKQINAKKNNFSKIIFISKINEVNFLVGFFPQKIEFWIGL